MPGGAAYKGKAGGRTAENLSLFLRAFSYFIHNLSYSGHRMKGLMQTRPFVLTPAAQLRLQGRRFSWQT
jgi:hypothetical protein